MKLLGLVLIGCLFAFADHTSEKKMHPPASEFACSGSAGNYRPYSTREGARGVPLGQGTMKTLEECQSAVANSNNGVICSRTGIEGWKATHYSGHTQSRPDYGYINGSSVYSFKDCLKSTRNSTKGGVCYFGDPGWYIGDINGKGRVGHGSSPTLDTCLRRLLGPDKEILPPILRESKHEKE